MSEHIVDDEQRRNCPPPPFATRVPAWISAAAALLCDVHRRRPRGADLQLLTRARNAVLYEAIPGLSIGPETAARLF